MDVVYQPPARRSGGPGGLAQDIKFAHFRLEWRNELFILLVAEWREDYATRTYTAILRRGGSESESIINSLIIAASSYTQELREEILVLNEGYALYHNGTNNNGHTQFSKWSLSFWSKNHELWVEVQKASWGDVILDDDLKTTVQNDVNNFFKSEKIFKELAIPWKRGAWGFILSALLHALSNLCASQASLCMAPRKLILSIYNSSRLLVF